MNPSQNTDPLFDRIPMIVIGSWLSILVCTVVLQLQQVYEMQRSANATHAAASEKNTSRGPRGSRKIYRPAAPMHAPSVPRL